MIAAASTGRWTSSPLIRRGEISCHCETIPPNSAKRVGDYRVFFDLDRDERLIRVHDIVRRTSTTYRRR